MLAKSLVVAGILLFALGTSACALMALEVGLTSLSLAIICIFTAYSVKIGAILDKLPVISFLFGYAMSWCFGFLGYYYLLQHSELGFQAPGDFTRITASLVVLSLLGTCGGGWLAFRIVGTRKMSEKFNGSRRQPAVMYLLVFGLFYLVYEYEYVKVFGFNARWDTGSDLKVGSNYYFVSGLHAMAYPFYIAIGLSLRRKFWSMRNLGMGILLSVSVVLQFLTGGREPALEPIFFVGLAALFSPINWRNLALLSLAGISGALLLMIVLGRARDESGFAEGSLREKVAATQRAIRFGDSSGNPVRTDASVLLFSRLFEPSAQIVIDGVSRTSIHSGLINMERLEFLFIPKVIGKSKLPLDDGDERLVMDYGVRSDEFSSSPLTLVADSYDRFGVVGVVVFHIFVGICLVVVARVIMLCKYDVLRIIWMGCFARIALRLYPSSDLGFIQAVFYGFPRDAVIIASVFLFAFFVNGIWERPEKDYRIV
jgi:hypothetical protein